MDGGFSSFFSYICASVSLKTNGNETYHYRRAVRHRVRQFAGRGGRRTGPFAREIRHRNLFQGVLRQGEPDLDTFLPRSGAGEGAADAGRRAGEARAETLDRYP